jgi:sulfur transfer protein SufE
VFICDLRLFKAICAGNGLELVLWGMIAETGCKWRINECQSQVFLDIDAKDNLLCIICIAESDS